MELRIVPHVKLELVQIMLVLVVRIAALVKCLMPEQIKVQLTRKIVLRVLLVLDVLIEMLITWSSVEKELTDAVQIRPTLVSHVQVVRNVQILMRIQSPVQIVNTLLQDQLLVWWYQLVL